MKTPDNSLKQTVALGLAAIGLFASTLPSANAQTAISWNGATSATWSDGNNWTGGTAPSNDLVSNIASFNLATYGGNPVYNPNADTTSIAGIAIGDLTNTSLTIAGTSLRIGASGITKANGSAAATISSPIRLDADQTWTNSSATNLLFTGAITSSSTARTLNLSANGLTGQIALNAGTFSSVNASTFNVTSGRIYQATNGSNTWGAGTGANANTVNIANGATVSVGYNNGNVYNNNWILNGGSGIAGLNEGAALRIDLGTLNGSITLTTGTDSTIGSANRTSSIINGQITGAGAVTFGSVNTNGGQAQTISNTNNNWTGGLTIQGGNNTETLILGNSGVITDSVSVKFHNTTTTNRATLNLNGKDETVDLLISSGTSASTATGIITTTNAALSTLTIGGGSESSATFTGVIQNGSGTIALTKIGSGTQVLSGVNTYSGATTVSAGTLLISNANGIGMGSSIAVAGGALNSTVANVNTGSLSVGGGTLAANGSSVGSYTLGAGKNFTLAGGSFEMTLASTSSYDQIFATASAGSETFSITGGTLALSGFAGFEGVAGVGNSYNLLSGFDSGSVSGLTITGYDTANWEATVSNAGVLTFTAVPEPSTSLLIGAGIALVLLRSRRRTVA